MIQSDYLEAKKSLGQNFLKNKTLISKMAAVAKISEGDLVVEIGPGTGYLTEELLKKAKNEGFSVLAIEKDHRAIPILEEKFKDCIESGIFTLIEGDIMEIDFATLPHFSKSNSNSSLKSSVDSHLQKITANYHIIANIPYYITGAIIRRGLEAKNKPKNIIIMVQKEVAQRAIAKDEKESLLSLSIKAFGEPKLEFIVTKGNFVPPPKVDSAVLSIKNINDSQFKSHQITEKLFFDVLHAGFAHKRKKLVSNLTVLLEKQKIEEIFKKISLDNDIRPEHMHISSWFLLTQEIQKVI